MTKTTHGSTSLRDHLDQLPVELLLKIAGYLGASFDDDEAPRSTTAQIFLHILMTSSRRMRAVVRPIYWREVRIPSKHRWTKLKSLLRGNRFKKNPAILQPEAIVILDLELESPGTGHGGLDESDLREIATILPAIGHLRLRFNEQCSLSKRVAQGAPTYLQLLRNFGPLMTAREQMPLEQPDASTALQPGSRSLLSLSLMNVRPQPLYQVMELLTTMPILRTLVLDNILVPNGSEMPHGLQLILPQLTSFTFRNSPDAYFSEQTGFGVLLSSALRLEKLVLRDCDFESIFLESTLSHHAHSLRHLELGCSTPQTITDRGHLSCLVYAGQWSYDTGFHYPMDFLRSTYCVGDAAARICTQLDTLTLGGLRCVSPALLAALAEPDRKPLHTLRLFNAWPIRPLRDDDDARAKEEKEAIMANPSGLAPSDLTHFLGGGRLISCLELAAMGPEYDMTTEAEAAQLAHRCLDLGIAFSCA